MSATASPTPILTYFSSHSCQQPNPPYHITHINRPSKSKNVLRQPQTSRPVEQSPHLKTTPTSLPNRHVARPSNTFFPSPTHTAHVGHRYPLSFRQPFPPPSHTFFRLLPAAIFHFYAQLPSLSSTSLPATAPCKARACILIITPAHRNIPSHRPQPHLSHPATAQPSVWPFHASVALLSAAVSTSFSCRRRTR